MPSSVLSHSLPAAFPPESVCTLCPRRCGARRTETEGSGVCGMPAFPVLARAALHTGEEPCISGTRGSGTVFFSGCSLHCIYCQNRPISHERYGRPVTPERLAEIFRELEAQGAHNINLVKKVVVKLIQCLNGQDLAGTIFAILIHIIVKLFVILNC